VARGIDPFSGPMLADQPAAEPEAHG
jgi:hypothetical protein